MTVKLESLQDHHCRYIIGETNGLDTEYCGEQVKAFSCFCPSHHARCFHKPPHRKRQERPNWSVGARI